ncbi:MAG: pyridoxamine 5'-phosphate oxidase family protein [Pseudomonadota bacterium]
MSDNETFYGQAARQLQRRHDTEKLADALSDAIVADQLSDDQAAFIASLDFFYLATVSNDGEPTVSYKGGAPGFVRVMSPGKLMFPNYDGNGMFLSMGNIHETRHIGLLFMSFETPQRLRVQGKACLQEDADSLALFPGANMVVQVDITSCFVNCARYIHKHSRVEHSPYIPDDLGNQPFPSWKRIDKFKSALPPEDQDQAGQHGGLLTHEEYRRLLAKGES